MAIAHLMLDQQNYVLGPGAEEAFRAYLERRVLRPRFAHGRSVRNSIDRARLRQANRLFAQGARELSREELMTITPDDILPRASSPRTASPRTPTTCRILGAV